MMDRTLIAFVGAALAGGVALADPAPGSSAGSAGAASRFGGEVYELRAVLGEGVPTRTREGAFATTPRGTCPIEPALQNYVGFGEVSVPGFVQGEEAAAILNAPASHYPIEIVSIAIGWSSAFGGQPDTLENALKLYAGTLPNPGDAQFVAAGPVLVDGAINEFDITGFVGNRVIPSGPFMASLEFLNNSISGGPAPLHDNAGCQSGKSAVKVNGLVWFDNCTLGVSGQWVINVKYRRTECGIIDCNGNGIHDPFEIAQGLASDCNMNGIPDECDIAAGAPDLNMDGILDECQIACEGDLTGDGLVNAGDLAVLLSRWGACP